MFVRASDDLKSHMVAADTMEDFQKDLDQGKVSYQTMTQTLPQQRKQSMTRLFCFIDCSDPILWSNRLRGLDQENHHQVRPF